MEGRWQKKTSGDLPDRVGKMTRDSYARMFSKSTDDQRGILHAALMVAIERKNTGLAKRGFMAKSVDEVCFVLGQPLSKAGPLPTLKKGCDCEHEKKMLGKCDCDKLPMTGKADQMLEEVPWAVKQLMSQLPLEMQATELGGAGSTDIRPAMDQMNYENPARNAGDCGTCNHVREAPGVLMCSALAGDPAVGPFARCDLWTGSTHKSQQHLITLRKAKQIAKGNLKKGAGGVSMSRNADGGYGMTNAEPKDGNVRSYQEQTMPDYQMVYGSADKQQSRQEREASIRRRLSMSFQHNAKYGFHGQPPEPTLKFEQDETVQWAPRAPRKVSTKEPIVVAPRIEPNTPPLRGRSFLAPRLTMAGKQREVESKHTDAQNGREMEELMFFPDRDDAEQYAGPRGLKVVPCDESLAKLYGVMVGGYVIEHPDTRMFLTAS